jgi:hypothetical protein
MRYVLTLTAAVALFLSAGCSIPLGPRDSGDKAPTQPSAPPPPPPAFPNHGAMP